MASSDSTSPPPERPASAHSNPYRPKAKEFHAFLCYSSKDEKLVKETLAYLEGPEVGFKCADHSRDFRPGRDIADNIEYCIKNSAKFVLFMSPAFVSSQWCKHEMKLALEDRKESVIPLLLEPCAIPSALSTLTYLPLSRTNWREKLVASIKAENKKLSQQDMDEVIENAQANMEKYQRSADQYKQSKDDLQLEKFAVKAEIRNTYALALKEIIDELKRLEQKKINEIDEVFDEKLSHVLNKMSTTKKILSQFKKYGPLREDYDFKEQLVKNLQDFEELSDKQRFRVEFMSSRTLLEEVKQLLNKYEVDFLQEHDLAVMDSEDDKKKYLKELAPSTAIFPKHGVISPLSVIKCPHFTLDVMTVRSSRSILDDGSLCNKPPSQPHPPCDRRLKTYRGALGTMTFCHGQMFYFESLATVNIQQKLTERDLVFEVALCTQPELDREVYADDGTISVRTCRCRSHEGMLCLMVQKHQKADLHLPLTENKVGQCPPTHLGYLLDMLRGELRVYDVTRHELITTIKDIDVTQPLTPVFGVFAPGIAVVKLSVITGSQLQLSDEMHTEIQKALVNTE